MKYWNIHTHRKPQSMAEIVVRNAYLPSMNFLDHCPYAVSVGLHTWCIPQFLNFNVTNLIALAEHPKVVAIGECGIDRIIKVDLVQQEKILLEHFEIAAQVQKPLIFHAVKSYSDFLPLLKKLQIPAVFHGYEGNLEQTKAFSTYPVHFSFGKNLLHPSPKVQAVLDYLPLNRIFVETDNAPIHIEVLYRALSEIKKISLEEIQNQIEQNMKLFFK